MKRPRSILRSAARKQSRLRDAAKAKRGDLAREIGGPRVGSVREPWGDSNVMAGLTPPKLARVLKQANRGNNRDLLSLYMEMEERDPHYGALMGIRKRSVTSLPVIIEPADESDKAREIAEAVQRDVIDPPQFRDLLRHAMDAVAKGYSAVEIIWQRGQVWKPSHYEWRDPRWFQFDEDDACTLRLRDESNIWGLELERYKWVTHFANQRSGLPVRDGIARMVVWSYLFKNYSIKDWVTFCEAYGMPIRIGKYGAGATEADKDILFAAVMGIGVDQAAVIPESMKIEFETAMSGSANAAIFMNLADWCDKQISKAVLGATMITDEGKSGGYAQSKTHDGVREDLRDDDAIQLGRTVNGSVIRDYVDLNYGPQDAYPSAYLQTEEDEELSDWLKRVLEAVDHGLPVDADTIYDKLDLPRPAKGAMLLASTRGSTAPSEANLELARLQLAHLAAGRVHHARADSEDEIDRLTEAALSDWQPMLEPIREQIIAEIEAATSREDLDLRLASLAASMDSSVMARALGQAMFQARGLGDAKD